jgi:PAS domain S-box-containing protein
MHRAAERGRLPAVAELESIYATVPVGLCCVDRDLRYVSVNEQLARYNGLPIEAHFGRTLREIVPHLADTIEPIYRRVLDTGRPELNVELFGSTEADPHVVHTWICNYSPLRDEQGRVIGVNTVVHDTTDRRASAVALDDATAALRQRDEFLDVIGDRLPEAMLFRVLHPRDGGYTFTWVSKGTAAVTGLSPETILRDPDAFARQIVDEDRPRFLDAMASALRTLSTFDHTCRLRWPDGSLHWCRVRSAVRPIDNGAVVCEGVIINTTGLIEAEEALVESQDRYRAIVSALPDLTFLLDTSGRYLDVHPRESRSLLMPPDRFIGKHINEVMPPDLAALLMPCIEQVAGGGTAQADYPVTINGDTRQYEARMVPCGANKILAVVRDVTESKRAQHDAERARLELAHVTRVTMLGEITASLAHELNQPLTAIVTNAQTARRSLSGDVVRPMDVGALIEEIAGAGQRAGDIIRRLRSWFVRERVPPQRLDLNEVVREVERFLHSELIIRQVRLKLAGHRHLPPVLADRVQIQQVLLNLALNGMEAMHERPVKERLLTISTSVVDREVHVAVRDRGTGLAAAQLDRLFEPFLSTKPSGLGVGLRICSSIITAHDGRIWATNNDDDAGATFVFTLPVAPDRR